MLFSYEHKFKRDPVFDQKLKALLVPQIIKDKGIKFTTSQSDQDLADMVERARIKNVGG